MTESFAQIGLKVDIAINGQPLGQGSPQRVVELSMQGRSVDWKDDPSDSAADLLAATVSAFLCLLPIDDSRAELQGTDAVFAVEGSKTQVLVNRYERSRSNRALAIVAHGTTCLVCGTNFGDMYGPIGVGYVEIHHLMPVHSMDAPSVVDPLNDLVPLCANCHRMAHRSDPPHTPDELRQMIAEASN